MITSINNVATTVPVIVSKKSTFWSGMILYNKNNVKISNSKMLLKLIVSSLLVLVIVNIFLTSFWLKILYGNAYWIIVSTRIITQIIMLPIQVIVMFSLEKFTRPYVNKYLMEE